MIEPFAALCPTNPPTSAFAVTVELDDEPMMLRVL